MSRPVYTLHRLVVLGIAIVFALSLHPDSLRAQPSNADAHAVMPLAGGSSLSISIGLLSRVQVTTSDADATVKAAGFLGSFAYTYWPTGTVGLEAAVSLHDSEVTLSSSSSVISVLVGANYYPTAMAVGQTVRPYVGASVGPYVGTVSSTNPFAEAQAETQTVFGGRLTAGADVFPVRWLRLGVRTAYHAMPNFDPAVGTLEHARGPQFSLDLGVRFGGRR